MTELSLERMREDLGRVLEEKPENIGDEDNLIDLGLDSIRTMLLIDQWRQAGARLEFIDCAAQPYLGHWWRLVQCGSAV